MHMWSRSMRSRFTKLMGAIPTPQKGGRCFSYIVTEVVRFIMQTITKRLAYIVTCSIKSEVNVVSVEVCQMSGNVVYQQEFEKPQIPTSFSSLKKQVLAKLIDTTQQTIRLLVDNEEPSVRRKIWTKHGTKRSRQE